MDQVIMTPFYGLKVVRGLQLQYLGSAIYMNTDIDVYKMIESGRYYYVQAVFAAEDPKLVWDLQFSKWLDITFGNPYKANLMLDVGE